MGIPNSVLGILELVAASGGEIDTRIRLQKEAFLLACSGSERFSVDDFEYHHYGPYSRKISDSVRFAVSLGLIDEEAHPTEGGQSRYSYHVSGAGKSMLAENEPMSDRHSDSVQVMAKNHWRALELAATVRFFELKEGFSDRPTAFEEALRLKPATSKFKSDAEAVLGTL